MYDAMRMNQFASVARQLMNQHGLTDWIFQWDRALKRAGCCFYRRKTITLSHFYVANPKNPTEDIIDTILHEIAHGKAGHGAGHGPLWKQICIQIGARPKRCYGDNIEMPKGRYRAVCGGCGKEFYKHRLRNLNDGYRYCVKCGPERGKLAFVDLGS